MKSLSPLRTYRTADQKSGDIAEGQVVPSADEAKPQQLLDVTLSLIAEGDPIAGQSPDELPLRSFMKLNVDTIALKGPLLGPDQPNAKEVTKPFYEWFQDKDFTGFQLLLSGVVTGAARVINLWRIPDAAQVVKAWQKIGSAERNSNMQVLGNAYFKLDDIVASEVQDVFVTFAEAIQPNDMAAGDPYYVRASCLLRTSDIELFFRDNQLDKIPNGFQRILTTYAVTGQLNRVYQYFWYVDGDAPHIGGGEPYWKKLEKDAANMLKQLPSYNRSFRTSVELLRPSDYDPWFVRRQKAGVGQ